MFIDTLERRTLFSTFTFQLPDVAANVSDVLVLPTLQSGAARLEYSFTIDHKASATGVESAIGVDISTTAKISGSGIGSFAQFETAVSLTAAHPTDEQTAPTTLINFVDAGALSGQPLNFTSAAQSHISYDGYVDHLSLSDRIVNRSVTITYTAVPATHVVTKHRIRAKAEPSSAPSAYRLAADILATNTELLS
jgi:hypothetical protein